MPKIVIRDLVKDAFALSGIVPLPDVPTDQEIKTGLMLLNTEADSFDAEGAWKWNDNHYQLSIVSGQKSYTLSTDSGVSPDLVVSQVVEKLYSAKISDDGSTDWDPLTVLSERDAEKIACLSDDDQEGEPIYCWIRQVDSETTTIEFYPKPTESATVQIDCLSTFSGFGLNDVISVPSGYKKAMLFTLTSLIQDQYSKPNTFNTKATYARNVIKAKVHNLSLAHRDSVTGMNSNAGPRMFNSVTNPIGWDV